MQITILTTGGNSRKGTNLSHTPYQTFTHLEYFHTKPRRFEPIQRRSSTRFLRGGINPFSTLLTPPYDPHRQPTGLLHKSDERYRYAHTCTHQEAPFFYSLL